MLKNNFVTVCSEDDFAEEALSLSGDGETTTISVLEER